MCNEMPPAVFQTKYRRAAKEHRCYECRLMVPKATHYFKISGCWDSSWSHYNLCSVCWALHCYLVQQHRKAPQTFPCPPTLGSLDEGLEYVVAEGYTLPELFSLGQYLW